MSKLRSDSQVVHSGMNVFVGSVDVDGEMKGSYASVNGDWC